METYKENFKSDRHKHGAGLIETTGREPPDKLDAAVPPFGHQEAAAARTARAALPRERLWSCRCSALCPPRARRRHRPSPRTRAGSSLSSPGGSDKRGGGSLQAPSPFRAEASPAPLGLDRQTAALSGVVALGARPRGVPRAKARRGARGNTHGTGGETTPRPAAAANTAPGRSVSKSTKTARPGRQHGRPKDYNSRHARSAASPASEPPGHRLSARQHRARKPRRAPSAGQHGEGPPCPSAEERIGHGSLRATN